MKDQKKISPKTCSTKKCNKTSIHSYTDSGTKQKCCLIHIPPHERDILKTDRWEYSILNTILKNIPEDDVEYIKHNQRATGELKFRPDLLIKSSKTGDIVIVEIDEKQHSKHVEEDIDRENDLIRSLSSDAKNIHIVRVIPRENSKISRVVKKDTLGLVIKDNNHDEVMDFISKKVVKRISGLASPIRNPKRKSQSYVVSTCMQEFKSPVNRTTFDSLYMNTNPVSSKKKFIDGDQDPDNSKYTYSNLSPVIGRKKNSPETELSEMIKKNHFEMKMLKFKKKTKPIKYIFLFTYFMGFVFFEF